MRNIQGYKAEQYQDYSAMRGPCPEGFHIPAVSEGTLLCSMATSLLGTNAQLKRTYLMLPGALYLDSVTGQPSIYRGGNKYSGKCFCAGLSGYYPYIIMWQNTDNIYSLKMEYLTTDSACAFSVRPFKDEPIIPDGSWTVLYQPDGATGADVVGIYHNSTLGLISISANGTVRLTIADKNLGATQVYVNDAVATFDNCGYYYQFGNNHGFPFDGATTTSSTLVDTSGYLPSTYDSSTFILTSSSSSGYNPRWLDYNNAKDLRGGVTGVKTGYRIK